MSFIHFNLRHSARLGTMAPQPAGGGFTNATLPPGMNMQGTYIIVNADTNNRYVGIATNIHARFVPRLATVTELGFAITTMDRIGVTWGETRTWDSNQQHLNGLGILNNATGQVVQPAPPAAFNATIDGSIVNLERLLIRFCLTQLGAGGTVSNNALAATAYLNPTPNIVTVRLTWGAMGLLFAPGYQQAQWGVNQQW